jgi:hypothetical protein
MGAEVQEGSVARAAVWMIGLSILLIWLPVLGPFVAGVVGGREARSLGKGLVAALVPAVLLGLLVGVILALFDLPLIGTVAGIGVLLWVAFEDIPMFIGAALGGFLAERRAI